MLLKNPASNRYKFILPIGFSLVIALMILTSLAALIPLKNNSTLLLETAEKHSSNDELLRKMYQSGLKRSLIVFEMIHEDDPFKVDELYMRLNVLATEFTLAREALIKNDLSDDLQKLFDQQAQLAREIVPKQNKVHEYLQQERKEEAAEYYIKNTLPYSEKFLNIIHDMSSIENAHNKNIFTEFGGDNNGLLLAVLLFDLVSILFSILLTVFIMKKQNARDNKLTLIASTDTLTKLPNLIRFTDDVDHQITNKPIENFSIIFFDIDNFKVINDNYGHEIGDKVIQMFSSKIQSHINKEDILSRFGGDEFVLMLRSPKTQEATIKFINNLSSVLDTSFIINDSEIFITASIGVAFYDEHGKDAKSLLKNADVAMYSAKETGRNCYQLFSKESSDQLKKDHFIRQSLHTILKHNNTTKELYLKYQPLINMKNEGITECEALIRWKDKFGNNISPNEFIPLAEKNNLIEKINLFVIDEACLQQKEWQNTDTNNIRININLSGNKIIFKKLLNRFHSNMQKMNLSPSLFGIELTERTLNQVSDDTIFELDLMRQQGIKISIDDFGTDYSSLIYLKKLPVTTLKIDKEFICGLPENKYDQALVKTIISLGHSLELDVVAEGVETIEQQKFLKENACNIAQGYLFHHPLDADQIPELLRFKHAA